MLIRKLLFSACLFLISCFAHAQFVKGIGATLGLTICKQKWVYAETDVERKTKNRFGLNASIFAEMIDHDHIRWVSELQYNQKGSKEKPPEGGKYRNRIDYLSFNNFIKLREEGYSIVPYLIAGPRIEYRLGTKAQIYEPIIKDFKKLHLSVSGGFGIEFIDYDPWAFFAEVQYNPDVTNAYRNKVLQDLQIKHRAWEIRVGIKRLLYNFEACP